MVGDGWVGGGGYREGKEDIIGGLREKNEEMRIMKKAM
jgi:hypothetical protein